MLEPTHENSFGPFIGKINEERLVLDATPSLPLNLGVQATREVSLQQLK